MKKEELLKIVQSRNLNFEKKLDIVNEKIEELKKLLDGSMYSCSELKIYEVDKAKQILSYTNEIANDIANIYEDLIQQSRGDLWFYNLRLSESDISHMVNSDLQEIKDLKDETLYKIQMINLRHRINQIVSLLDALEEMKQMHIINSAMAKLYITDTDEKDLKAIRF